eukprot:TRINITY_DN91562_c0_g1_i1.p1 TRINITY_DN91562_c0_g1~~TRINITY_DN91562_c0_g1_i1.p1  ORF type:complete len:258 (+),score=55.39 TRINITY_DN91562_c0_g1_i1:157-930(+)
MTARREFAPYASEFFGTFFLVFTVGLNVLQNHPLGPLSVGFMLTALIFTSGDVSGAHFNPAVTLGIVLSGRGLISIKRAVFYVLVQLLAALCATCVVWTLLGDTFGLQPGHGYSTLQAAMVETLYSTALVFVVLNTATLSHETKSPFQDEFNGLAIGLTIVAAAFACGAVSGCSLNPALAVGALVTHSMHYGSAGSAALVYVLCPLLGGGLAAAGFRVVRQHEYDEKVLKIERERREGLIPDTHRAREALPPREESP